MKKNAVIIAGIALLAAALIAMPVSAGNGQGGNSGGCDVIQSGDISCAGYSYGNSQSGGYEIQNTGQYCFKNSEGCCLNNGACTNYGTPYRYGGFADCPCI